VLALGRPAGQLFGARRVNCCNVEQDTFELLSQKNWLANKKNVCTINEENQSKFGFQIITGKNVII